MEFVPYTTQFTESIDHLLIDSFGLNPLRTFEDAYDAVPAIDERLTKAANDWCKENFSPSIEDLIQVDKSKCRRLYMLQSVVGDDETTTSDSAALGPLIITVGPEINGILLSKKDTGISTEVGNYAEGWVIIPPTMDSSFESVNRRHSRDGVPFVLDGIKLKLISAVRKQSKLELDLESKIKKVSESASWVNPLWFTYDYHQMMVILATNTFDFRDSRSFPYLYNTEGGCGGLPPYGNLDTCLSAIFAFHKGRAKRTIYGIMDECVSCHQGRLKPNETFFLRSSHIAQLGDTAWLKYDQVYRDLLKNSTAVNVKNLLSLMADKDHLPSELLEKGAEISPDNVLVGSAISHLRSDNFIMTELDVKMSLENQKKVEALGGTVPYKTILADIEKDKESFKSNSWVVLGQLARYLPVGYSRSTSALEELPNGEEREFAHDIMRNYFSLRSESYCNFTSFHYTDAIRVFKTTDVQDYMKKKSNVLRSDIVLQADLENIIRFSNDIAAERERKERIFSWINTAELNVLLHEPLPPGIGPDDSRIMLAIIERMDSYPESSSSTTPLVLILITGDRKLVRTISTYAKERYKNSFWIIVGIEPMQYVGLCLEDCKVSLESTKKTTVDSSKDVSIWNYIRQIYMPLPKQAFDELCGLVSKIHKCNRFHYLVEYDYPNIERALEPTTFNPTRNIVSVRHGGFLNVKTLSNFTARQSWAHLDMSEIFSWDDFDMSKKTKYAIKRIPDMGRFINAPMRPEFYRAIGSWQQSVPPR